MKCVLFDDGSRSHKKHIERFYSELDPELYGTKYWFTRGKFWGMNDYLYSNAVMHEFLNSTMLSIRTVRPVLRDRNN